MEKLKGQSWHSIENPLLEGLPTFQNIEDLVGGLAFDPLDGLDVSTLNFVDRIALLTGEKTPLEPTLQSVDAALTWWGMLVTGLRARNPYLPQAKQQYWNLINSAACGVDAFPAMPTKGMALHVVKGPTGTGKSVTAQRFLQLLPSFIGRKADDRAGWKEIKQLIYLNLMVSHDGSRGGFLIGILMEMDRVLGTDYARELPKAFRTVEKLAVATIARLIAHYTGIAFVDEGQLRNLVESGQAELMQMFLLLLMNSGIPIVMIGNERAFDWVTYSQDKSRLYINPPAIFSPAGAINLANVENEWDPIAMGVMKYYLLMKPITDYAECVKVLRRCSGGIARLALILWCTAQKEALLSGRETIGPMDIVSAYESRGFDDLRPLADGFNFRKPELLMAYKDVDHHFYAEHWGVNLPKSERNVFPTNSGSTQEVARKRTRTGKEKFAAEQTRKRKKQEKRDALTKSLSPEDIRRQGLVNVNLAGLESLRQEMNKEK